MSQLTLVNRFHQAMLGIHHAAGRLKPPYHATGFLTMVNELGGKEAADRLLAKGTPSDGFTELFLRGRDNLKISVEYLVLQNPWRGLFNDNQLAVARQRLHEVHCELPPDDLENLDSAGEHAPPEEIVAHQLSGSHGMDVTTLADQINKAAAKYRVGSLQQLRAKLHGKRARTKDIFHKATIFPKADGGYAFHDGGRTELQFNIGVEMRGKERCWRHGVAFSFEKSQTLPNPNSLRPRVRRFNEWVRANTDALRDFHMWDWVETTRSDFRSPGEILADPLADFIAEDAFVFLGAMVPEPKVDVHQILRDFDRLFDLYEHVESESKTTDKTFPGGKPQHQVSKATRTIMSRLAGEIEVDLRHNLLQQLLVTILKSDFPGCPIQPEREVAGNRRVDVAVDANSGAVFCEIKVAPDAARCGCARRLGNYWSIPTGPRTAGRRSGGSCPRGCRPPRKSRTCRP